MSTRETKSVFVSTAFHVVWESFISFFSSCPILHPMREFSSLLFFVEIVTLKLQFLHRISLVQANVERVNCGVIVVFRTNFFFGRKNNNKYFSSSYHAFVSWKLTPENFEKEEIKFSNFAFFLYF